MIINMFTHIGHRKGMSFPAESMIETMDENRVDRAVICCTLENLDNEYVYQSYLKYPDRFIPCAVINPWDYGAEEELEKCFRDWGFYGVKFSATRFGFAGDREGLLGPLFELCRKYGKFVIVHGLSDLFSMPDKWRVMALKYPDVPLIINHTGVPTMCDRTIEIARTVPNVYLSTAVTFPPALEKAIRVLDGEKILFSSDSPYSLMAEEMEKIAFCCRDEKIREKIFCGNARKLLDSQGQL